MAIDHPSGADPASHAAAQRAADGASQPAAQHLGVRRRAERQHGGDGGTREKIGFHGRSPLETAAHPRPSMEVYDRGDRFHPAGLGFFRA
jgi:hypothetical protein